MSECAVPGCERLATGAKGLCSAHYQRLRYRGTLDAHIPVQITRDHRARFWSKVDVDTESECWLWTGGANANGYGVFTVRPRHFYAHRYGWYLRYGMFPDRHLHHRCGTPLCVNPDHLELVTAQDHARLHPAQPWKWCKKRLHELTPENRRDGGGCRQCAYKRQAAWKRAERARKRQPATPGNTS